MDTVVPFRAWRYAPTAGDPALLVAPPYDVIGPDLQSRLYARSRHNVVRVDLGMTTPSDNDCDNRYTRAAAQLRAWKESGVLTRDAAPTLTFVEEQFTGPDDRARVRYGFLAAVRLHAFSEGVVYPHEQTFSGPKEDRFELMDTTAMSLSPVFLLYDLPGNEITSAWSTGPGTRPPATEVTDEDGNITKLWPTCDPALLETVGQDLAAARFIIADGHHRYETALRYRDHRRERDEEAASFGRRDREPDGAAPAYEYVLAYLSNMADPGLAIYATHRLVTGVDPEKIAALPQALAGTFAVEPLRPASPGTAGVRQSIERFLASHPRGAFGVWAPAAGEAYGLRLLDHAAVARRLLNNDAPPPGRDGQVREKDAGSARSSATYATEDTLSRRPVRSGGQGFVVQQPSKATPGHTPAYQALDVTFLQKLILEQALAISPEGLAAETNVAFFKDAGDAFARLENGEFQAGFFMNPTGLEQVREAAFAGERMPHKATFFYPKLPTGLVFQDLAGLL